MPKILILVLVTFVVACGDVSKKFPDAGNNENNGTSGVNNGTVGVNNTNNGTVATNNATTSPNNGTTTPNNVTVPPVNNANNQNTNNANTNNQNTNNGTVTPGPTIAYISGQAGEFDTELVLANYAFVHVGGDEEPLLGDLRSFWLDGDADDYDVIVVEWGFHHTHLSESYSQDVTAVETAVRRWVESGGILLDLSGGFSYNVFTDFYVIDFVLVQAGTYTAFAQDASMPHAELSWTKADDDRNMAGIVPGSVDPADGEAVLVDGDVTICAIPDFQCADPISGQRTALFMSKDVDQGIVYHGGWVPPLDDRVVDTVLSVLPPP